MCYQINGKSVQASKCVKSRIITKVIYYVLFIDTSEQHCSVIKFMVKSLCLKYHMKTIGIDQYLSNSALFKHRCLQNIKNLYKHAGKWEDQQQFKDILEATIVSTTEVFTDNSPTYPMKTTPVKKPSARKLLCLFTNILYVKKTSIRQFGADKSKRKAIKRRNYAMDNENKEKSKLKNQRL